MCEPMITAFKKMYPTPLHEELNEVFLCRHEPDHHLLPPNHHITSQVPLNSLSGGTVGVDLVHVRSGGVDAAQNEGGGDVALITEQHALEHGTRGDDAALRSAHVHPEELELARYELGGLLGVGGGAGAAAVDVGGEVVDLLAVLVGHLRAAGGPGVGAKDDAVLVDEADDGGARLGGHGEVAGARSGGRRGGRSVSTSVGGAGLLLLHLLDHGIAVHILKGEARRRRALRSGRSCELRHGCFFVVPILGGRLII